MRARMAACSSGSSWPMASRWWAMLSGAWRSSSSKMSTSALMARAMARRRRTSRLAGAGFVAAELADVDAGLVGEGGLGEPSLFAEGGEAGPEAHGGQVRDGCQQRRA